MDSEKLSSMYADIVTVSRRSSPVSSLTSSRLSCGTRSPARSKRSGGRTHACFSIPNEIPVLDP